MVLWPSSPPGAPRAHPGTLMGNAEKLRNLGLGPSRRRDYVLPQQRAGMGRAPIRIALGGMSHDYLSFSDIARSLSDRHRHLRIRS